MKIIKDKDIVFICVNLVAENGCCSWRLIIIESLTISRRPQTLWHVTNSMVRNEVLVYVFKL